MVFFKLLIFNNFNIAKKYKKAKILVPISEFLSQ
jgi:hypothetical protein